MQEVLLNSKIVKEANGSKKPSRLPTFAHNYGADLWIKIVELKKLK